MCHFVAYKVVYCLLQKIYRQPLKKITFLAARLRFLAQGQGLGWQDQGQGKASDCKAKAKNFGLKAIAKAKA